MQNIFGDIFKAHSLPVIGCMLPQTRKGTCLVAEQSFGMYNHIHRVVFELCLLKNERKKEDEQNRNCSVYNGDWAAFSHPGILTEMYVNIVSAWWRPVKVETLRIIVIRCVHWIRNNEVLYIHLCQNTWVRKSGQIAIVIVIQNPCGFSDCNCDDSWLPLSLLSCLLNFPI